MWLTVLKYLWKFLKYSIKWIPYLYNLFPKNKNKPKVNYQNEVRTTVTKDNKIEREVYYDNNKLITKSILNKYSHDIILASVLLVLIISFISIKIHNLNKKNTNLIKDITILEINENRLVETIENKDKTIKELQELHKRTIENIEKSNNKKEVITKYIDKSNETDCVNTLIPTNILDQLH